MSHFLGVVEGLRNLDNCWFDHLHGSAIDVLYRPFRTATLIDSTADMQKLVKDLAAAGTRCWTAFSPRPQQFRLSCLRRIQTLSEPRNPLAP
jgi:hypothetical protein